MCVYANAAVCGLRVAQDCLYFFPIFCLLEKMPSASAFLYCLFADACWALHVNSANSAPFVHGQIASSEDKVATTLHARCGAECSEVRSFSKSVSQPCWYALVAGHEGGRVVLALHNARFGLMRSQQRQRQSCPCSPPWRILLCRRQVSLLIHSLYHVGLRVGDPQASNTTSWRHALGVASAIAEVPSRTLESALPSSAEGLTSGWATTSDQQRHDMVGHVGDVRMRFGARYSVHHDCRLQVEERHCKQASRCVFLGSCVSACAAREFV